MVLAGIVVGALGVLTDTAVTHASAVMALRRADPRYEPRSAGLGAAGAPNSQSIAEPMVATIVGCLALIAAVPITTGLASMLVSRLPLDVLPDSHHHHH